MSGADDKPMFERMGKVYKLLVDEKARRRREESLLLAAADRARSAGVRRKRPVRSTRILDLACGTGFHSRIFARAGYPVLALDASRSLLDQARKLSKGINGIQFDEADLLESSPVARPAVLALLLGNTLSLFSQPGDLRRVFRNVADALVPGGLVLCQILNFGRLQREGAVVTTRRGTVEGRETSLVKVLEPADDGSILIHLSAAQRQPGGEWETFSKASVMVPLEPYALKRAARAAGLTPLEEWGGMDRAPWRPETSTDYVVQLQRKS